MTDNQQRVAFLRHIWQIAYKVAGAVDGWDFKQFVLGTLFYRFISENIASYIEADLGGINYAALKDDVITPKIVRDALKNKGYFIYPSQLFGNFVRNANSNENLNSDLDTIFSAIEKSAVGYSSEGKIKDLFADFDTSSNRLGSNVVAKKVRLVEVLESISELDFGDFKGGQIDLFGDAYEFLISNYAANAGRWGGEFFTPQYVSNLIARLGVHKQTNVNKIYDPACGTGSLLLQAKKHCDANAVVDGFFGQEINRPTYNLARMNMFIHNINVDKFEIGLGNTLTSPRFWADKPFDAIVSNPPYSMKWVGSDDPTLINDDRYAPAGVLAPRSHADFAFVLHALNYLSAKGRAVIACFPGMLFRGGTEQKIRKYLVDNNYVETVISLAPNQFYGTAIAKSVMVLAKNKPDFTTQFIDASGEEFFKKIKHNNVMLNGHIERILDIFDKKENIDHVAASVEHEKIKQNNYNLSVSSYIEGRNTREIIDIMKLNSEIRTTTGKIDQLRTGLEAVIAEIES